MGALHVPILPIFLEALYLHCFECCRNDRSKVPSKEY